MNPQQLQKWMDKLIGDPSGLAYLKSLDLLLAKQVISITEQSDIRQRFYRPRTPQFDLDNVC